MEGCRSMAPQGAGSRTNLMVINTNVMAQAAASRLEASSQAQQVVMQKDGDWRNGRLFAIGRAAAGTAALRRLPVRPGPTLGRWMESVESRDKIFAHINNSIKLCRVKPHLTRFLWTLLLIPLICSSCKTPQQKAVSHFTTGRNDAYSGNQTNALAEFSRAIEFNPQYRDAYFLRGVTKYCLKDYDGAILDFTKVVELGPTNKVENGSAFVARGLCKFALKDYNGAMADYDEAIEIDTNNANAYNYRGLAQAALRDWHSANGDLNKAVETTPEDATFYRNRALVEYPIKEYEKALADSSKSEFIAQAGINTNRPSAIIEQVSEAYFYAGMKHKLAGDEQGAASLFQKCLDAGDDNNLGNWSARSELHKTVH